MFIKYDVHVATDVTSRGIDISKISHVISFDIPGTVDAYIHWIARTGREEQPGLSFTLSGQEDAPMYEKSRCV